MAADGGAAAAQQAGGDEAHQAPIIIKRVKKGGHDAHHGGAWKVAYADFVTAMMAFFLLLWLLNATTEEQKLGISNYFSPESVSYTKSGSGGVMGGKTLTKPGPNESPSSPTGITVPLPRPQSPENDPKAKGKMRPGAGVMRGDAKGNLEREARAFKEIEKKLREAISKIPELKGLTKNILVETTPEGLKIQLLDRNKVAMFPSGSATMHPHTKKILKQIAKLAMKMGNKIAISGHTDATPYADGSGYTNWELSADRANASRRILRSFGVPADRIIRVMGKADRELLIKAKPKDPRNRRISIVLIRKYPMAKGKKPGKRAAR